MVKPLSASTPTLRRDFASLGTIVVVRAASDKLFGGVSGFNYVAVGNCEKFAP